jgi:hypothetical protein
MVACIAVNWVVYPRALKRRLRDLCRERLGTDRPFLVQIEFSQDRFQVKQLGTTITHGWTAIAGVEEMPDSLAIVPRRGDLVAVRKRAFASQEEMAAFVELIYHHRARWPTRPGDALLERPDQ